MKSKSYWEKEASGPNPFELPKQIANSIEASGKKQHTHLAPETTVPYIWIYVTEDGLRHGSSSSCGDATLELDGWLNVIDEAAALGAEWMVIHTSAPFSSVPHIWRLCEWAQEAHSLRVGLHLSCNCLSEDDLEQLGRLDAAKTYLLVDRQLMESFRYLEESGVQVIEANVPPEERAKYCTKPGGIACVGADGRLFSCGLVMGDERFALGDSQDRRLGEVMSDETLPHLVPDTDAFPTNGCDACPPLVAGRVSDTQG